MAIRREDEVYLVDTVIPIIREVTRYLEMQDRLDARRQRITKDAETEFSPLTEAVRTMYDDLVVYLEREQSDRAYGARRRELERLLARVREACDHSRKVRLARGTRCVRCRQVFEVSAVAS